MVTDYSGSDQWIPGVVLQKPGPVNYSVEIAQGQVVKRHTDKLTQRLANPIITVTTPIAQTEPTVLNNYDYPSIEEAPIPQEPEEPTTTRQHQERAHHPLDHFMVISQT